MREFTVRKHLQRVTYKRDVHFDDYDGEHHAYRYNHCALQRSAEPELSLSWSGDRNRYPNCNQPDRTFVAPWTAAHAPQNEVRTPRDRFSALFPPVAFCW